MRVAGSRASSKPSASEPVQSKTGAGEAAGPEHNALAVVNDQREQRRCNHGDDLVRKGSMAIAKQSQKSPFEVHPELVDRPPQLFVLSSKLSNALFQFLHMVETALASTTSGFGWKRQKSQHRSRYQARAP
jgi:hypothetical protein